MIKKIINFAIVYLVVFCTSAHAAKEEKSLSPEERKIISGMSITTLIHEPVPAFIYGVRFLVGSEEDKKIVGTLLGDPTGSVLNGGFNYFGGDEAIRVPIAGMDDPAHLIAQDIQPHLIRIGLIPLDKKDKTILLPATPLKGNLMPKTNIDELIDNSQEADLALSVQTYSWQITRHSVMTGAFLAYINRMTLINRHTKDVLLEQNCSFIVRHKMKELNSLHAYLENDKYMLKKDLHASYIHCRDKFINLLKDK